MSLRDDINIPLVVVLGVTTGLIVAVAIIGTQAGYNYATQAELARNYEDPNPAVQAQLHFGEHVWAPQRAALAKPAAWSDLNKTTVRIPLEDAKRIMLATHGKPPIAAGAAPADGGAAPAGSGNPNAGNNNAPGDNPPPRENSGQPGTGNTTPPGPAQPGQPTSQPAQLRSAT